MKLSTAELDLQSALAEFDVWITPSLGEIRDTVRFQEELGRIVKVFDALEEATAGFADIEHCDPEAIADTFIGMLHDRNDAECLATLNSLASVLFLVAMLKQFHRETDLLAPLVVFKVRGSVSASGGHGPEDLLRLRLTGWGLRSGVDFNLADVVIGNNAGGPSRREKTRAYDFVLPYQTREWEPRVFVQCQFYAGDSGSVSHKNVDQTSSSREHVSRMVAEPRFVEYVDGAGYFSSLNGDLQNLLSMPTTGSFFQIRSAPIRLRRELQAIGFLCPLDLEHAILRSSGSGDATTRLLRSEGYGDREIARCIEDSLRFQVIGREGTGELKLLPQRRELVRRYFLLDTVACFGHSPSPNDRLSGSLIVPGYGPFFSMKLDELVARAVALAPLLKIDWQDPLAVTGDIRALCDDGMAMSC